MVAGWLVAFGVIAGWPVAGLGEVGAMFIDAHIVRKSRNAVVNIGEKPSK